MVVIDMINARDVLEGRRLLHHALAV